MPLTLEDAVHFIPRDVSRSVLEEMLGDSVILAHLPSPPPRPWYQKLLSRIARPLGYRLVIRHKDDMHCYGCEED